LTFVHVISYVRFRSKADIEASSGNVCFTPESGHQDVGCAKNPDREDTIGVRRASMPAPTLKENRRQQMG